MVDGKSAVEELGLNTLRNPSCSFWNGKRVLLTGHTGFKGSWLAWWLQRLGAEVTGIALPSLATPDLFTLLEIESLCESRFCDIRDSERLAGSQLSDRVSQEDCLSSGLRLPESPKTTIVKCRAPF